MDGLACSRGNVLIMAEINWEWVYPNQHGRVYPPDSAIKTSYQGETVYICKRCDHVYKTRVNLNRHWRTGPCQPSPGKYPCRACPKTFRKDYHRRVHETVHPNRIDQPSRIVLNNPLTTSIVPSVQSIQPIRVTEPLILPPVNDPIDGSIKGWHDYSWVIPIKYSPT